MSHKQSDPISQWQRPHVSWPLLASILGGLALMGLVVYAVWAAATGDTGGPRVAVEVQGAPSIKPDKDNVDLGTIHYGQTVKVDFQIANVGDQQLRLSQQPYIEVVEGCCPPPVTVDSLNLNSGQTMTLSTSFMMHEGMGGKHNYRLHLPSNDPTQPDRTLTILSNWIP